MSNEKTKALAYIHRDVGQLKEILVFDHLDFTEAGTQIVDGTVESCEDSREALLREILEEARLVFHTIDIHPISQTIYQRKGLPRKKSSQLLSYLFAPEFTKGTTTRGEDEGICTALACAVFEG